MQLQVQKGKQQRPKMQPQGRKGKQQRPTMQLQGRKGKQQRPTIQLHCKKRLAIFPSPARMSLTKLSLAGKNVIIPGQGEFGKWHPGLGQENRQPFFTVYKVGKGSNRGLESDCSYRVGRKAVNGLEWSYKIRKGSRRGIECSCSVGKVKQQRPRMQLQGWKSSKCLSCS
jgi:hypothetical protein